MKKKKKSLLQIYRDALQKYDAKIDEKDEKACRKCVCEKGCKSCCYQMVVITDFEKEVLRRYLKSLSFMEQKSYWVISRWLVGQLITNDITPETVRVNISESGQKKIQEKYFNLHLSCPFLGLNDECNIHNTRPIACMTYRNYGDVSACENSPFVEVSLTHNDIEWEMRKELFKETELPFDGLHILPYAVLDILKSKRFLFEPTPLPFAYYKPRKEAGLLDMKKF